MNKLKRMLALVLCAAELSSALVMPAAAAENGTDSDKSYLVLGADLSDSQRATVLDLLGVTDAANYKEDYNVYYTTNAEEHQYLDKYLSASVIGTNSLSSIKLTARDAGKGISISTKNISYCTVEMYQNALITAGVSDVELVVAGPSNISGTAALVSAMKAYEIMTGEKLSEDSVDAANNELVVTGEVGDELGDASKAAELIAAVKNEVLANGDKDLTDDEIGAAIDRICKEMGITLDPSTRQQIIDLIKKIGSTDFDVDALKEQAKGLFDKVEGVLNEISGGDTQGFFARLWDKIVSFFQSLFQ